LIRMNRVYVFIIMAKTYFIRKTNDLLLFFSGKGGLV